MLNETIDICVVLFFNVFHEMRATRNEERKWVGARVAKGDGL